MNTNLEEAKNQKPAKPRIRRLNPTPKLLNLWISREVQKKHFLVGQIDNKYLFA